MLLLIPGPVTTRPEVRAALGHDFAPWDNDFRPLLAGLRERLLRIAGGTPDTAHRAAVARLRPFHHRGGGAHLHPAGRQAADPRHRIL